jgi:putative transcriptional regulator
VKCFTEVPKIEVTYNKLFKLLVDRKIQVAELHKETGLSSCTFTKLKRDEAVTINVLLKIAEYLNCDISDICEFIKTDNTIIIRNTRR